MLKNGSDRKSLLFISIITIILVLDLFLNSGQSANMDGFTHITTMAQFFSALRSGDLKVTWLDKFANYGLPLGVFVHQLGSYLGAALTFLTHNVVVSYNLVFFIGAILSGIFFYFFLRLYFDPLVSAVSAFLFQFTTYRIFNMYVRGAIHEYISAVFVPPILMSIYYLLIKRKRWAFFTLTISLALLFLIHPMMGVIYFPLFFFYFLFYFIADIKKNRKVDINILSLFFVAGLIGFGIAAYYYIPLMIEKKYLFIGFWKNQFEPNQTLSAANYIQSAWPYFYKDGVLNRGNFIHFGIIETIGLAAGLLFSLYRLLSGTDTKRNPLYLFLVFSSVLLVFLTTEQSVFLYKVIDPLGNIQFPWRMLSSLVFLPPIVYALLFERLKAFKLPVVILFIFLIAVSRFPQLYGKNYQLHPSSDYYFTPYNLHSNKMNTIWTDETEKYPIESGKPAIIEGKGKVESAQVSNSWRKYVINADSQVRMIDHTFYFPGWKVYIDGVPTTIEFQDINYRGVITYKVPPGTHNIVVRFEETKVRMLGNLVSLFSVCVLLAVYFLERKFRILKFIINPQAV